MIEKLDRIGQAWRAHPVIDGVLGGLASFFISAILISLASPAWAISVPIGNLFVIDLGDLPPWIGAFVFFITWWEARRGRKKAEEAAIKAAAGVAKIQEVSAQIDGMLKDRDAAKVKEGEVKGKQAGVEAAEQLAEGQRQGRETERESVAAQGATVASATPAAGKNPLPVADDKNTKASERVAAATEQMAKAQDRAADAAEAKTENENPARALSSPPG